MWPFHEHKWLEVNRQFGYKDDWGHFHLQQTYFLEKAVTLITFSCDKCDKIRQKELTGHVPKEKNSIPSVFRKEF